MSLKEGLDSGEEAILDWVDDEYDIDDDIDFQKLEDFNTGMTLKLLKAPDDARRDRAEKILNDVIERSRSMINENIDDLTKQINKLETATTGNVSELERINERINQARKTSSILKALSTKRLNIFRRDRSILEEDISRKEFIKNRGFRTLGGIKEFLPVIEESEIRDTLKQAGIELEGDRIVREGL